MEEYPFSEEFLIEYPDTKKTLEAIREENRRTTRNIDELQMRLNLQIEADKERLWSDDKTPELLDLESILNNHWLPYSLYDEPYDERKFRTNELIYSLFYNNPKYLVFTPDHLMFK